MMYKSQFTLWLFLSRVTYTHVYIYINCIYYRKVQSDEKVISESKKLNDFLPHNLTVYHSFDYLCHNYSLPILWDSTYFYIDVYVICSLVPVHQSLFVMIISRRLMFSEWSKAEQHDTDSQQLYNTHDQWNTLNIEAKSWNKSQMKGVSKRNNTLRWVSSSPQIAHARRSPQIHNIRKICLYTHVLLYVCNFGHDTVTASFDTHLPRPRWSTKSTKAWRWSCDLSCASADVRVPAVNPALEMLSWSSSAALCEDLCVCVDERCCCHVADSSPGVAQARGEELSALAISQHALRSGRVI